MKRANLIICNDPFNNCVHKCLMGVLSNLRGWSLVIICLWLATSLPVGIDGFLSNLGCDRDSEFVTGVDPILDMLVGKVVTQNGGACCFFEGVDLEMRVLGTLLPDENIYNNDETSSRKGCTGKICTHYDRQLL